MESEFDVVILGSGPAGLQAAVHAARAKAATAVLGKVGSSALYKAHVENYCCMNDAVSGEDILKEGRGQAEKFGARLMDEDVLHIERLEDGRFSVKLKSGDTLLVKAVILAMGISRNKLNVPGKRNSWERGLATAWTVTPIFFETRWSPSSATGPPQPPAC